MAQHNFLLTYSVDAKTKIGRDKADKVRGEIAKIEKWNKLTNVETTFKGSVTVAETSSGLLRGILPERIKNMAITAVKNEFMTILVVNQAEEADVIIHCAMMVTGAGEAFEFEVSN
ncbi:hypothetical protein C0J08_14550 [Marinomonas sp. CT5]|uniref:hypothetical protein n=1 Tax=Marinomonas sp. CT5 TaxID=2066133 RepID=UPI001BAEB168|nr:hypothetical protein [Marinomonas sp. CT5]QUX96543.1 hypothetical protein C0J08_14550 [Marinomonas sp. CT5]